MEEVESSWGDKLSLIRQKFTELSTGHEACFLTISSLRKAGIWLALACSFIGIVPLCKLNILSPLVSAVVITAVVVFFLFPSSKETVLVIKNVGVYLTRQSWYGFNQSTFIPSVIISDVIIFEAISLHKVSFFLALLVQRHTEASYKEPCQLRLVPLFADFTPRLPTLRSMYLDIREILVTNETHSP